MTKKRKSFLLHIDSLDILDDLEDQQVANLFRAIKAHQNEQDYELDSLTKIAFVPFKNQFERDQKKYEETCKRRAEAGSKGGKAKVANASKSKQNIANLADNKNKNKNKSKNKSDSDNKEISTVRRFSPPTDIETVSYFQEKGSTPQEAEKFWYFYDAKNWMVGKNKMKNWKSAASGWISRNNNENKSQSMLEQSANQDWHKQDTGF